MPSREKVLQVGGYPAEFFLGHEGGDLGYRLIGAGYRVMHTPRISTTHYAASEHRPDWRVYYYYTRNGIWVAYRSFPPVMAISRVLAYLATMGFFGCARGRFRRICGDASMACAGYRAWTGANLDAESLKARARRFGPSGCRYLEGIQRRLRSERIL